MKGSIKINFNEATMIEAIQQYLDHQLQETHTVKSVNATGSSTYGNTFEISIEGVEEEGET